MLNPYTEWYMNFTYTISFSPIILSYSSDSDIFLDTIIKDVASRFGQGQ